jgi:hypothetical protein
VENLFDEISMPVKFVIKILVDMKTISILLVLLNTYGFAYNAVLYNGAGASSHDKYIALTIAGIVNRDSAQLYLLNVYETWSYNKTDEIWRDLYRSRGNVIFDSVASISQLIEIFRPFIKGGITYDGNRYFSNFSGQYFKWQGEYASLIGGLTDRIPVTAASAAQYNINIDDSVLIVDSFDNDSPLWVTGKLELQSHSWNASGLTEEQRYLILLNWGVQNLLPRCNPSKFYIREITDFTVQQKMFQVNLAGTDGLDFNSMPSARADVIEDVLEFLHSKNFHSIFHIYGWIHPEPMVQWFAHFGSSFHETLLGNLSWHSAFPVDERLYIPKSTVRGDTSTVRDKYYLVFIGTEGDASNWNIGFQSGAWLSSARGAVPVGWGWNLHLMELCPFIASYYYDSATPNDGFLTVTSPLGYAYPDLWNDDVWGSAVDTTIYLMGKFNIKNFYGYKHYAPNGLIVFRGKTISNSFNFSRFGQFQTAVDAQLTFVFDPLLQTQRANTTYGTLIFNHVNDGSFYGDASNLPDMANRILNAIRTKPKPFFLLAGYQRFRQDEFSSRTDPSYVDINLPRLKELVNLLKNDASIGQNIEVVTPEYFSVLLRKSLGLSNFNESITATDDFKLFQNYPNPFNPSTTVRFNLKEKTFIQLRVYNVIGEEVAVLVNDEFEAGIHEAQWDAEQFSSGIYFFNLTAGGANKNIKALLVK